jgi:hypothetical protein
MLRVLLSHRDNRAAVLIHFEECALGFSHARLEYLLGFGNKRLLFFRLHCL